MNWIIFGVILMVIGGGLLWAASLVPATTFTGQGFVNVLLRLAGICLVGGYIAIIVQIMTSWNIEWTPLRSISLVVGPPIAIIPASLVLHRWWKKKQRDKRMRVFSMSELMEKIDEAEIKGDWDKAIEFSAEALKRDVKNPDLWARKAFFLTRVIRPDVGEAVCTRAIALAIVHCDGALAINPSHKEALLIKAEALAMTAQWKESVECCNRVLAQDDKEARAWFTKGVVLSELKDQSQSCECLKQAHSLGDPRAAKIIAESGTPEQFLQFFSGGDGSTLEKAIVIKMDGSPAADFVGISLEYAWLERFHPKMKTAGQRLHHQNGRSFDVLTVQTPSGEKKEFYFDITSFFGAEDHKTAEDSQ